jgi:hypothetical protein
MKRIVVMGLFTNSNQGDPLIHRTVELYTRSREERTEWKDFNLRILFEAAYCIERHFKEFDSVILVGGSVIYYKFHDYWTTISASLLARKKIWN